VVWCGRVVSKRDGDISIHVRRTAPHGHGPRDKRWQQKSHPAAAGLTSELQLRHPGQKFPLLLPLFLCFFPPLLVDEAEYPISEDDDDDVFTPNPGRYIVVVGTQNDRADGPARRPDGPRSGRSAGVARTVRACAESVRVPSFSRDLLPKTAGLTRKSVGSGSRPPLYIDEGLRPIEPPTIEPIQLLSRIYFQHN
jgi:hypothetical protein